MPITPFDVPLEAVRAAAKNQLRLGSVAENQRGQQNIGVAGVRTSGVGLIPLQAAARNRALGAAGIDQTIANQQAGFLGQDALAKQQHAFDLENLQLEAKIADERARTNARRGLQGALISGGIGLGTTALTGGLSGAFPNAFKFLNKGP